MPTPLLTTEQAASFMQISVWTLRALVKANLVPCVKINRRLFRFRQDALEKWIAGQETTT